MLVIFAVKMTGLHTFSHSDDASDAPQCDLCEFVVLDNQFPVLSSDSYEAIEPAPEYVVREEAGYDYHFDHIQGLIDQSLFSRPPPTLS